jgi:hypothetical protein
VTQKKAFTLFVRDILPSIEERELKPYGGKRDLGLRREAWVNFIDNLHKEGRITDKQVNSWDQVY